MECTGANGLASCHTGEAVVRSFTDPRNCASFLTMLYQAALQTRVGDAPGRTEAKPHFTFVLSSFLPVSALKRSTYSSISRRIARPICR